MSEDSSIMRNIDKVSYGVAVLLGLVFLAVPMFSGGSLTQAAGDLDKDAEQLEQKLSEQKPLPDPKLTPLGESLGDQWAVTKAEAENFWVTERAPILIKETPKIIFDAAVHKPGKILKVELVRNSEKKKPALKITGQMGENQHVRIQRVTLYKKRGDENAVPVIGFSANGDFEYIDEDVRPGAQYSYSLLSRAESTNPRQHALAAGSEEQTSQELGPTLPVPYNVHLQILFVRDEGGVPTARGRTKYYDYSKGEVISEKTATYKEGDLLDSSKRFEVKQIRPGSRPEVRIRDLLERRSITITTKSKRPVDDWPSPLEASAEEPEVEGEIDGDPGEDLDDTVEDNGTTEPAPEKKPRPRPRPGGRRKPRFGGGDG